MKKCGIIICIVVLSTIYSFADAQCRTHGQSCTDSTQCTTHYCRLGKCIIYGESFDDVGINPCFGVNCQSRKNRCVLDQVICVRAPCKPIPRCAQTQC